MNLDDMDVSPELREKAQACKTPEELLALAKREGYKLSEDELQAVSGGWMCGEDIEEICGLYGDANPNNR